MTEVHSTEELSRIFGRSEQTVRRWSRQGILPAVRLGKSWYASSEAVEALLAGRGDAQRAATSGAEVG